MVRYMSVGNDTIPVSLVSWIKENITRPLRGFEDKKNADGSPYSFRQQMRATYHQLIEIVGDLISRGKPHSSIKDTLISFK
jgi:hypothetical protein